MHVGELIKSLRENMGISQSDLCRGIISTAQLSRIENDRKQMPFSIIEALFQRLGRCSDRFVSQMGENDYVPYLQREKLIEKAERGFGVSDGLEEYKHTADMSLSVERQYCKMMQGIDIYRRNADTESAIRLLEEAISETMEEDYIHVPDRRLLCTQEIHLLQIWVYINQESGEYNKPYVILKHLDTYIRIRISDDEEMGRVMPQQCFLMARHCIFKGKADDAKESIEEGIDCISRNGLTTLALEYLKLRVQYGDYPELALKDQNAFCYMYELAGNRNPEDTLMQFVRVNRHREFVLTSEIIYDTRMYLGLSQEELAFGICSTETISRLENGHHKPNRKTHHNIYKHLGLDKISFTIMDSNDIGLFEKDRFMRMCFTKGELDRAELLFNEIRKSLDRTLPVNMQYIEYMEVLFKHHRMKMSHDVALRLLRNALNYTFKSQGDDLYRIPLGNEPSILTTMAVIQRRKCNMKEAESIYKSLYEKYSKSKIDLLFYSRHIPSLYTNLTGLTEAMDKLDESKNFANKGLVFDLKLCRGDHAARLLANLSVTLLKKNNGKISDQSLSCADAAYRINAFYNDINGARTIKTIFTMAGD